MRILYDGHIFRWQKVGGINRYFCEVISRLPQDWAPTLLGAEGLGSDLPRHPGLSFSASSSVRPRRFSQPIKKAWWNMRYVRGANLFHPTFYILTGGLQLKDFKCPLVITVHDFISLDFAHLEPDAGAEVAHGNRCQSEAILQATHAVCVSKATEKGLLERFPQMAGKSSVIHHGSSFDVNLTPQPDDIFEVPSFLVVGRRRTYKNFMFLLRSFRKACQSHGKIRLHVAGEPLSADERWEMHLLGISDRVDSTVFPDEQTLQQLYRKSVALLYPSRHEGFGIPALEAMACGTVAVTSDTTSLPEVVGDGGIMLDPADKDAWTDCILQIANRKIQRQELLERGRRRVAMFSWEKSAQSHIELYKRLA